MTKHRLIAIRTILCSLAVALALVAYAAPAYAEEANPHWHILTRTAPRYLHPGQKGWVIAVIANVGDAPVVGTEADPLEITEALPEAVAGVGEVMALEKMAGFSEPGTNFGPNKPALECESLPALRCPFVGAIPVGTAIEVHIPVEAKLAAPLGAGETKELGEGRVTIAGGETPGGGEAPEKVGKAPITVSNGEAPFGVESYELSPETPTGSPDDQAGSHPFQLTTTIAFNQTFTVETKAGNEKELLPGVAELPRNIKTVLPPGLVGNTNTSVIPQCTDLDFSTVFQGNYNDCPPATAVGFAVVTFRAAGQAPGYVTESLPVFNLVPGPGEPARLGLEFAHVPITLGTTLRTGKGYAVEVESKNTSELAEVLSVSVTVWGVPGAASHEQERGWACMGGGWRYYALEGPHPKCPAAGPQPAQPYLTLPTTCEAPLETSLQVQSWKPGAKFVEAPKAAEETLEGCSTLPFSPSFEVQAEGSPGVAEHSASTPTGLTVTVDVPQATTLEATEAETPKAEADVKATTVTFPEGVLANAGLANGLQACTSEQVGFEAPEEEGTLNAQLENNLFTAEPASCPEASKIGTVNIDAPLINEPVTGSVYLAREDTSPFKSPLVLYLIAEAKKAGVRVKLAGEVKINQETGQLTSTFRGTPPVPFETLELKLPNEEGGRASNSTPPHCGSYPTSAQFTTYSAEGALPATTTTRSSSPSGFEITQGAEGGPCPPTPLAFTPGFAAGSSNPQAGATTPFEVTIGHADGQQALETINTTLPAGAAALIAEVTPCSEAQAEANACPPESLVGHTTSVSGLGGRPVTLGGQLYLTGALKANSLHGAGPFGLLAVTNAEHVGPFNLGDVDVFSTININPETAVATVQSAQIPKMIKGAPVQLKELNVVVERPGDQPFQFNPTNCSPLATTGALSGYEGGVQPISAPFNAANCASLPFAPKITATVSGQGSKVNGVTFDVTIETPGLGQADIHRVDLTLPKALPSRLETIQKACKDEVFIVNPAACDEGSVIGEGIVHTPVFKNPLRGPAYLVSHGGAEFPDVEFVLQGEGVTIIADGKTFIENGITYSKFETNPDAPFTKFESVFPEGPHSALGVDSLITGTARNLCAQKLSIPTELEGWNGAQIKDTTPIEITGCSGHLGEKAKKLTRAQLLAKALKTCRTKYKAKSKKAKRLSCEKQARKKYGPKKKPAKKKAKKSAKSAHK